MRGGLGGEGLTQRRVPVLPTRYHQERSSGRGWGEFRVDRQRVVNKEVRLRMPWIEVGEFSARHKRLRREAGATCALDHGSGQGLRESRRRTNGQFKTGLFLSQLTGAVHDGSQVKAVLQSQQIGQCNARTCPGCA